MFLPGFGLSTQPEVCFERLKYTAPVKRPVNLHNSAYGNLLLVFLLAVFTNKIDSISKRFLVL